MVLSELEAGGDGTMAGEFTAMLEQLWRFLSRRPWRKGRDGEERRLLDAADGRSPMRR